MLAINRGWHCLKQDGTNTIVISDSFYKSLLHQMLKLWCTAVRSVNICIYNTVFLQLVKRELKKLLLF